MSRVYTDLAAKIDLGYLFTDESLKSVNFKKTKKGFTRICYDSYRDGKLTSRNIN